MMSLKVRLHNVAVVVLLVLGIFFIFASMIVVYDGVAFHTAPLWVPVLGVVMLVAGMCLLFYGSWKQKKGV
jgi:protein-S-isoprenylcysteine O-methyltransferase Ste14